MKFDNRKKWLTDELFKEVHQEMRTVDEQYISFIDFGKRQGHFTQYVEPLNSGIFDLYRALVDDKNITPQNISEFLSDKSYILDRVSKNETKNVLYKQPIIFLLYYLAAKHGYVTRENWAFDQSYLDSIYSDLGVST